MKPASIISLIVAVVISIAGLITCIVAQNMAQSAGQDLFSDIKTDSSNNRRLDISPTDINKIQLIFDQAKVTVHGNSESSYIEFLNFKNNYYSLTSTSSMISFDETPDITSMLTFWESGFSFKGIRYILNLNKEDKTSGEKEIHIFLTSEHSIKQIDIQATDCTLNINNMTSGTDYLVNANVVSLTTNHINTTSSLSINAGKDVAPAAKVTFNSTGDYISKLNINAVELDMNAEGFMCTGSANVIFDKGSASVSSVGGIIFSLESENGDIYVNSVKESSPCTVGSNGGNVIISTTDGNIQVSTGAFNSGRPVTE